MLFLPSSDRLSLRFSPLTVCLATAGWKAPKRHWLAQTSVSLVCYLLLPSTISSSSSLSSPSPYYVPQELAARSRARMPEKIFPRRCHPLERKNPPHPDFCTFFPPSRPSPSNRRPFPFQISTSIEHTVHDHEIFRCFVSLSFGSSYIFSLLSIGDLTWTIILSVLTNI